MDVLPFWSCKDQLSFNDDILYRGDCIVVPATLRKSLTEKLHQAHIGVEWTLRVLFGGLVWIRSWNSSYLHAKFVNPSRETTWKKVWWVILFLIDPGSKSQLTLLSLKGNTIQYWPTTTAIGSNLIRWETKLQLKPLPCYSNNCHIGDFLMRLSLTVERISILRNFTILSEEADKTHEILTSPSSDRVFVKIFSNRDLF